MEMKFKQIGWLVTTKHVTRQFDPTLYPDDIRAAMERNGITFEAVYVKAED
jgi:hypothetical protein